MAVYTYYALTSTGTLAKHTHAVNESTGKALCGKTRSSNLYVDEGKHEPPTCPECLKRDPRQKSGGPPLLSSLLQF